jgi:hypothetical protein
MAVKSLSNFTAFTVRESQDYSGNQNCKVHMYQHTQQPKPVWNNMRMGTMTVQRQNKTVAKNHRSFVMIIVDRSTAASIEKVKVDKQSMRLWTSMLHHD